MKKISLKQQEIIDFINDFVQDKGYPPTVREIGKAVSLSSSASVHSQINKLEEKGLLRKDATSSRAITLVKPEEFSPVIQIPLLGKVTAGNPIEAIENVSEYFPIPATMVKGNESVFALTVSGDSMKNAGIFDNDRIIVQKMNTASNGEIVVVLTPENETTVKRFYKENDHFRLQPENENYQPILLKDVTIIGKVIGLYRNIV